jgi:3-oxoacyl-[acyl-carrier protein] reductase
MATEATLITGASSDIGCAVARSLLSRPDGPVVLAHSFSSRDRLLPLQTEFGNKLQLLQSDFSQRSSVEAMAEQIASEYGTPAEIIHLPALRLTYERFTKFNWDRFEADMAIQVESAVILLQKFLPKMVKLPRARVLFVLSSVVHGVPPKFMSMYTMIKYMQLGLMRSLAAEYASSSVRINAISPSMVETRFLQEIADVAVQMSASANPQGRNATPADLLGAIEFLLSPASDFVHGIDIPIAAGSVV